MDRLQTVLGTRTLMTQHFVWRSMGIFVWLIVTIVVCVGISLWMERNVLIQHLLKLLSIPLMQLKSMYTELQLLQASNILTSLISCTIYDCILWLHVIAYFTPGICQSTLSGHLPIGNVTAHVNVGICSGFNETYNSFTGFGSPSTILIEEYPKRTH